MTFFNLLPPNTTHQSTQKHTTLFIGKYSNIIRVFVILHILSIPFISATIVDTSTQSGHQQNMRRRAQIRFLHAQLHNSHNHWATASSNTGYIVSLSGDGASQDHLDPTTSIYSPLDQSKRKGKSRCPSRPDGVLMHSSDPSAASSSLSSARLEKAASLTRAAGNCPHVPPAGIKLMFRLLLSKLSRAGEGFFKAGGNYIGRLTVDVSFSISSPTG